MAALIKKLFRDSAMSFGLAISSPFIKRIPISDFTQILINCLFKKFPSFFQVRFMHLELPFVVKFFSSPDGSITAVSIHFISGGVNRRGLRQTFMTQFELCLP